MTPSVEIYRHEHRPRSGSVIEYPKKLVHGGSQNMKGRDPGGRTRGGAKELTKGLGDGFGGGVVVHDRGGGVRGRGSDVAGLGGELAEAPRELLEAPEPLDGRPDLGLTPDDDEDEDALEGVHDVRRVPDVLRPPDHPRDYVHDPRHTHDDHQLQAHAAQRRPETQQTESEFLHALTSV